MTTVTLQRNAVLAACADMIRACGLTVAEIVDELAKPQRASTMLMLPVIDQGELNANAAAARNPSAQPDQAARALTHNDRRVIDAADSPEGTTVNGVMELLGLQEAQAHRICSLLADSHHLIRVKKPGIRAMHFFAGPADALAWHQAQTQHDPAAQQEAAPAPALAAFPEAAPAAAPAVATLSSDEVRSVEVHAAKVAGSKKAPAPMGARKPHKPKPAAGQALTITPPKIDDSAMRPRGEAIITADTKITRDTAARPTARWQMRQEVPDERWPSFAAVRPGIDPATGKAWEARA